MHNNILLAVDDKAENLYILNELVVENLPDCHLLMTTSAEDGLAIASEKNVDGVILDVQMPRIDGLEMCRRLKANARTAHIPIVLITAHKSSPELRARGLEAGADDFISKPIGSIELVAKIKVLLRIKKAEDNLRALNSRLEELVEERMRELRESEKKYRSLSENVQDVIWTIDNDFRFTYVSPSIRYLRGFEPEEAIKQTVEETMTPESYRLVQETYERLLKAEAQGRMNEPAYLEIQQKRKDGSLVWVETRVKPILNDEGHRTGFIGVSRDISTRKQYEEERETTLKVLHLINSTNNTHELIQAITGFMQNWSGCEAVGIRLRDGDDFPYYETRGFPQEFVLAETHLCLRDENNDLIRDSQGNPVLECMCGNILCGRFDPNLPFFTPFGSFWSNCTTDLLASTTEADRQARTRNRCNGEGYESVALIPIRFGKKTLGLMQFNDKRKDRFTLELISFLERLADSLAAALEQRITQQELRASEERYSSLFKNMLDGFALHEIILDKNGAPEDYRFLSVNPAFERLTGLKAKNILGKRVLEVLPDLEYFWIETYGRVALTGEPLRFENYNQTLDRFFEVNAFRPQEGQLVCVFQDITERKKAEENLQWQTIVTEAINRVLQGALQVETDVDVARFCLSEAEELTGSKFGWIGEVNPSGRLDTIVLSNPGWELCAISGDKTAAIKNMEIRGLFGRVLKDEKTVIANEPSAHPDRVGLPNGHPEITAFLGVPLKQDSRIFGMIALGNKPSGYTLRDQEAIEAISVAFMEALQRKRAEKALRYSETLYHSLVENIPLFIFRKDAEGRITFANRLFCQGMNKTLPEILGKTDADFYPPDLADKYRKDDRHIIETGQIFETVEENKNLKGEIISVFVIKTPIYDAEGNIIGVQGIFQDITEKQQLEKQLLQAQKLEALGTLSGGIAHDFNNILTAIVGFTQLAYNSSGNPELVQKHLSMVMKASERAESLVGQILAFSRKSDMDKHPFFIASAIKEGLKLLRSTLPTTIEIKHNIDCESMVMGDLNQIHQILMNLCTNAAHAMREKGGVLEVSLTEREIQEKMLLQFPELSPGKYVCLTVKDNGHGIDPQILDKIFDPFFTTKDKSEGTGLGLSVVLGIVKSHKGGIKVESVVGQGTVFQVYLPVCGGSEKKEVKDRIPLKGNGEWILFADDEEALRKLGKNILETLGYQTVVCIDGQDALKNFLLDPPKYSLVMTDQTMPRMTGLQLAQEILKERPDIPILLYTGYDERVMPDSAAAIGIRQLMMKPIEIVQLSKVLYKLLSEKI